jgi:O-methyltransferase
MGTLRDFDLADYNCDVYVETGTGAGGTLSKAIPHFKKCYSVDMDLDCVSSARNRFSTAIIAHELSTAALEQWLKDNLSSDKTVLFFLDAHFPGSDYRGKPYDVSAPNAVPLEQELRLIKKYRPNAKDVIICDDARIYTIAEFENGNTEWLQVPGGYQFVYDIFPDATIRLTLSEEGYIIIDRRVESTDFTVKEYKMTLRNPADLIKRVFQKNSCVPPRKLLGLWEYVQEAPEGDILEVGSWRGGSSLMLAASAEQHKPNSHVYICDTFEGLVKVTDKDNFHKNGDFGDTTSKEVVEGLMVEYNLSNVTVHEGIFPEDTGNEVTSTKIAFIHIDVDVYQCYLDIFNWMEGKLVPGAIIAFDDYLIPTCEGATLAIDEYFKDNPNYDFIHDQIPLWPGAVPGPSTIWYKARAIYNPNKIRMIASKKNILVIRPAALGDVIMITGIVRALKQHHPQAAIDVATNNFDVFRNSTRIRHAAPASQFDRSQYDLVIDLEMAYELNPRMHTIDAYAAKAGINPATTDLHTELFVQPEHHAFLTQVGLPEKFVVVHQRQHFGTSRNLPRSFYIELMHKIISQTGHAVVQIGNNDDFTFGSIHGQLYDLTNQLSLHQTAALISRARAFIGIDGGPMHIAATTNTPIIGLFTSVKSEYRAPRNRNAAYIGIASDIECYGCVGNQPAPVTRYECVRGDNECTRKFSADDVITKLKTVL